MKKMMNSMVVLLLFIGMFAVTTGIYQQKLDALESHPKIEYRFIPRTLFDEQLGVTDNSTRYDDMLTKDVWADVTIGTDINNYDKTKVNDAKNSKNLSKL